jgi:hypothetical protein
MIHLKNETEYFILVDGQGASFGGGCLFESIEEVAEKFKEWADSDEYEDPTLKGWSISDCLDNWTFRLKYYDGADFVEAPERFINYIIN